MVYSLYLIKCSVIYAIYGTGRIKGESQPISGEIGFFSGTEKNSGKRLIAKIITSQ